MKSVVYDNNLGEYIDIFYLILLVHDKFTLLPEIMEVFGKESLMKFLSVFSGVTFRVPSLGDLKSSARSVDIYVSLSRSNNSTQKKYLGEKYGLTEDRIIKIYLEMKELVTLYHTKRITR